MSEMGLWMKAVPLAPVSSSTRFLSAQAQSSVEHNVHVHKATLLESAMSLTNGQLRPPQLCGHASVAQSTMGHHLLLLGSFHKNSVMFLSNRHSARVGAGAAESTESTVGRIMVHTMSARLWMDRFLLLHVFSRVNALASAFSHGATLGSREMMAPKYRVLSFGPRIMPGMTSGGGSCAMLPHRNDVVLCQLMDADDASM